MTLTSPSGQVFLEWPPETVLRAVQFPSFSKSIKYVGFHVADQGHYAFALDRASLKRLRALANRGIATSGPAAVRAVLRKAILTSLLGLLLFCGGLVFLCITIYEVTTGQSVTGSEHIVGSATTLTGFGILCSGIYKFYQYSQLKKLARETAQKAELSGR
jgi:uncharacterized membrane protein YgdD (TMEM256/DUF423 family)